MVYSTLVATENPTRPAIGEVHIDAQAVGSRITLHTYDHATAIQLGSLGPALGERMRTFDAAWAQLTDGERTHARAVHLDTSLDHVTGFPG